MRYNMTEMNMVSKLIRIIKRKIAYAYIYAHTHSYIHAYTDPYLHAHTYVCERDDTHYMNCKCNVMQAHPRENTFFTDSIILSLDKLYVIIIHIAPRVQCT